MSSRVIDIKFAHKWLDGMHADMVVAAKKGLLSAAIRVQQHIVTKLIPAESPRIPVDRGVYRAGFRTTKTEFGAILSNAVPHAVFIEHGVRASSVKGGRKLIDAITAWVKRKGIGNRVEVTTKQRKTTALKGKAKVWSVVNVNKIRLRKATDAEARGIAFAIVKSMQQKGIFNRRGQGLKIFERGMAMAKTFIQQETQAEFSKVTRGTK